MAKLSEVFSQMYSVDPAYAEIASTLGIPVKLLLFLMLIIFVWSVAWKGVALWKAARKTHKIWFVAFMLVHTVGILEILYIFIFSKMGEKKKK